MKGVIAWGIFWIALAIGWIANIFQLVAMMDSEVGAEFIIRVVGLFALPVGGIMGWLGFFT